MFAAPIATPSPTQITTIITAIGALGTAAYGLVDASKSLGGGVSLRGLSYIRSTLTPLLPESTIGGTASGLGRAAVFETVKSNWINGVASVDQQGIVKSLIKLRMDETNAATFAAITGVNPALLQSVIGKMASGVGLTRPETDVYGRFDLALSTIVSQAYQRADQQYRNTAKLLAVPVSVALAWCAAIEIAGGWSEAHLGVATVIGLIATPLAPIAKDIASAIQSGVKALQSWSS